MYIARIVIVAGLAKPLVASAGVIPVYSPKITRVTRTPMAVTSGSTVSVTNNSSVTAMMT